MENILAAMRNNFCEKTNINENKKVDVIAEMGQKVCEKTRTESAFDYIKISDNDRSVSKKLPENNKYLESLVNLKEEPISDDEYDEYEKETLLPIYQDQECIEICRVDCLSEKTKEKSKNSNNCDNKLSESSVPAICIKREYGLNLEENYATEYTQQIKLESKTGDVEDVNTISDLVNSRKEEETEELQDVIKTEELVVAWTENKHESSCADELPDFRGEHFSAPKFEDETGSNAEYGPESRLLQDEEEKELFEFRHHFLESEDENEEFDIEVDNYDHDHETNSNDNDDEEVESSVTKNIKRKRRKKRKMIMEQTETDVIAEIESEPMEKWCCKIRGKACFLCLNDERFKTKESLMQHIRNSHREVKLVAYKLKSKDGLEEPEVFYLVDTVEDGFGLCIDCYMVFYTTERASIHMISHVKSKSYMVNMPKLNRFRSCCKEKTVNCVQPTIVCGECKCHIRRSNCSLIRHGSRHWMDKGLFYPFKSLGTGAISRVCLPKHNMKSNLNMSASIKSNDSSDYKIVTTILAKDKCVIDKEINLTNNLIYDNNNIGNVNNVLSVMQQKFCTAPPSTKITLSSEGVNNVLSEMQLKFCTAPDGTKVALSSDNDLPYDDSDTRNANPKKYSNNPRWKCLKSVKIVDDIDIVETSLKKNDKNIQESPGGKNVALSSDSLLELASNSTEIDMWEFKSDEQKQQYLKDGNKKYKNVKRRKLAGGKREYLFINDIYGNSNEDVIVEVEPSKTMLKENDEAQMKRKIYNKQICNETGLPLNLKRVLVEKVEVPCGWKRMVFMRTAGKSAGRYDVYYYSPLGKRLTSKVQAEKHCKENGLNIDPRILNFNHNYNDEERCESYSFQTKAGNDLRREQDDDQEVIEIIKKMPGWKRKIVKRKGSHRVNDVYYYSPCGKKLSSMVEVKNHCLEKGLEVDFNLFRRIRSFMKMPNNPKTTKMPMDGEILMRNQDQLNELQEDQDQLKEHTNFEKSEGEEKDVSTFEKEGIFGMDRGKWTVSKIKRLANKIIEARPVGSKWGSVKCPLCLLDISKATNLKQHMIKQHVNERIKVIQKFKKMPGWRKEIVKRKDGHTSDIFYHSPCGKKLGSKIEIANHCLEKGFEVDLRIFQFTFNGNIRIFTNNPKPTKLPRDRETPMGNHDQLKESLESQVHHKRTKGDQDQLKESNSEKEEDCLVEPTNLAKNKIKKLEEYKLFGLTKSPFPYSDPNTKEKTSLDNILSEMQQKFCTKVETSESSLCIENELPFIKSIESNKCKTKQNYFNSSKKTMKNYRTGNKEDKNYVKRRRNKEELLTSKSSSKKLRTSKPENVYEPFCVKNYIRSHVNHNNFIVLRTRQQFWEEPQVRNILEGVKNKKIDMKCAASLLGVPYNTVYSKYRENYGLIRFSGSETTVSSRNGHDMLIWEEAPTRQLIKQVLNKEISLSAAAESLGLTTRTIIHYLRYNGEELKREMLTSKLSNTNSESNTGGKKKANTKL